MIDQLLQKLSIETGLRESLVHRIVISAPIRYKNFTIPKRSGGERLVSQPAREVKLLQRAFASLVLEKMPIHRAATAYIKGLSTRNNAQPHAGHGPILKLDFKDFFPSIKSSDWKNYCVANHIFQDEKDIEYSSSLLFVKQKGVRELRLAIGAPSSPMVSNILMHDIDQAISDRVSPEKVIYTRYADDLTFSAPRTGFLVNVIDVVKDIIRHNNSPRVFLNEDKTTYVTTRYRRSVTGLTLTNDGLISIGKEKKRIVHSAVHRALTGKLDFSETRKLAGTLAYINSVEPQFIDTLSRRYGSEIIQKIQKTVVIKTQGRSNQRPGQFDSQSSNTD